MENKLSFDWMLNPVSPKQFHDDYLEKQPCKIFRNDEHYYNRLLSSNQLDEILGLSGTLGSFDLKLKHPEFSIDRSQYVEKFQMENVSIDMKVTPEKVLDLFWKTGAQIVLYGIKELIPGITKIQEDLQNRYPCTLAAEIVISPPHAPDVEASYNKRDLFVLQISGKKRWTIYENVVKNPIGPQPTVNFDIADLCCLDRFESNPGDLIYIPRGFVYLPSSSEDTSVELGIFCSQKTWTKQLVNFTKQFSENHALMREGYFVEGLRSSANPQEKFELIKKEFLESLTHEINIKEKIY